MKKDWAKTLDRLIAGDRVAFLDASNLITAFLVEWRAYEFRDEWDDLIQEVVLATIQAARAKRLRNPAAIPGYLRTAARYKFVDWLRRRRPVPLPPEDAEPAGDVHWPPADPPEEGAWEVWDAIRNLPEKQQKIMLGVYREGKTHEEIARETGVPVGSVSRNVRDGLAALRQRFQPAGGEA